MEVEKTDIIIDFEFTGLDNTFITDNEIIQMKASFPNECTYSLQTFKSKKRNTAGSYICNRIDNSAVKEFFTKEAFYTNILKKKRHPLKVISNVEKDFVSKHCRLWGWGVSMDKMMLSKYLDHKITIHDLQEIYRLSEYEERIATEGSSLEAVYYIVFEKLPKIENHGGLDEMKIITELFNHKNKQKNEHLTLVPFGHCAGMPIKEYVEYFRRNADGYRYNNDDLFSRSLDYHIEIIEEEYFEDNFGEHY